jgi:thiol-disulfide isomerase/thioredoxin
MSLTRFVRRNSVLTILCLIAIVAGCSPSGTNVNEGFAESSANATSQRSSDDASVAHSVSSEPAVDLSMGDETTLLTLLKERQGQVVLVDFWATWCGPCMEQLAHTVELSHKHVDGGLSVIGVSMDNPESLDSVREALAGKGALFPNILTKYGAGSTFLSAFDLRGDIPFYRLYDRAGKLRYQFSSDPEGLANGESIGSMEDRLVELLNETRSPGDE